MFSGKYSPNLEKHEVERWYRFPAPSDCQLCRMMEAEISKDLIENGFARISLEGTCDVIQGFVNDVEVFTYPVEMERSDKEQNLLCDPKNPSSNHFDWLTAYVLPDSSISEASVPVEGNTGLQDKHDDGIIWPLLCNLKH